jgi:hypothetical protein
MNISSTEIIRERFRVADGTLRSDSLRLVCSFHLSAFFFFISSISSRLLKSNAQNGWPISPLSERQEKKREREREGGKRNTEMYKREAEY